MDGLNYTPLDTEKLNAKKKSFKLPNKVLIGLILFFTLGVGTLGFLLTRESLQTNVPAQVDTSVTETPVPSPTLEIPVSTTTEEPTQAPQESQASDEAAVDQLAMVPTEEPTEAPEPTQIEEPTPTDEPAIGGGEEPSPSPTEIVLADASSETEESAEEPTEAPAPSEVPAAGVATYGFIFTAVAATIIFFSLVF